MREATEMERFISKQLQVNQNHFINKLKTDNYSCNHDLNTRILQGWNLFQSFRSSFFFLKQLDIPLTKIYTPTLPTNYYMSDLGG